MTQSAYTHRRIFKSVVTSRKVIQELITLMVVSELLHPGPAVWIVSPWISDVPLLDNRAGSFDSINPEWGHREIRLTDLAVQLMAGGSALKLVTRPDEHNKVFIRRLADAADASAVRSLLSVTQRESLHTKGILTRRGLMLGSMNLTYNGLELNDEVIEYDTDPQALSNAEMAFEDYAGGRA
jgi:hypothetical protein